MKFDRIFLKVIHLDFNSDVNSQPFSMYFSMHYCLVLRQLPCKYGEVWLSTSKVIDEISVKFDWIFLIVIHLDFNSDVNSQPFFHVIFACTIGWYYGNIPINLAKFDWVLQKVLMRLRWNLIEYF